MKFVVCILLLATFATQAKSTKEELISNIDSLLISFQEPTACTVKDYNEIPSIVLNAIATKQSSSIVNMLPNGSLFLLDIKMRLAAGDKLNERKILKVIKGFTTEPELYNESMKGIKQNIIAGIAQSAEYVSTNQIDLANMKILDINTEDFDKEFGGMADRNGTLTSLFKVEHQYYRLLIRDIIRKGDCWSVVLQNKRGISISKR